MYKISYKLTNFLEWFITPIFLHKIWRSCIDTQPTEKINVNNAKSITRSHKKHYFSHFYSNIHPIREHSPYFYLMNITCMNMAFNIVLDLQCSRIENCAIPVMLYAMTGFGGFSFKSIASLTYRSCKYDCAINTEQY